VDFKKDLTKYKVYCDSAELTKWVHVLQSAEKPNADAPAKEEGDATPPTPEDSHPLDEPYSVPLTMSFPHDQEGPKLAAPLTSATSAGGKKKKKNKSKPKAPGGVKAKKEKKAKAAPKCQQAPAQVAAAWSISKHEKKKF